jgi:hypothetical protein
MELLVYPAIFFLWRSRRIAANPPADAPAPAGVVPLSLDQTP